MSKLRYDLVPNKAIEEMAKVMTKGCEIHNDRDWEKGNKWSEIQAKIDRHWNAFKNMDDFDSETGLLHISHALTNMAILVDYHKTYPQGDDRRRYNIKPPRIGLDIDEVLADFMGSWKEKYGITEPVLFWNFDKEMRIRYEQVKNDEDFWLNIKPKINPKDLPFEPVCYVTARNIDNDITAKWLHNNGFPTVPVVTVGVNGSKVEGIKDYKVDIFVDDRYENFVELTNAGIFCYLLTCDHNMKYDVGIRRIESLSELKF